MIIVAFLQNMWLRNPASYKRSLERSPTPGLLRRRMVRYALFAGCLTGRRLKASFGEDLCDKIEWEEASLVVADNPKDYHPPDPTHIKQVLEHLKPTAVLCFTRRGEPIIQQLVEDFDPKCHFFAAPHPAARQADVSARLEEVAVKVRVLIP